MTLTQEFEWFMEQVYSDVNKDGRQYKDMKQIWFAASLVTFVSVCQAAECDDDTMLDDLENELEENLNIETMQEH